MVDKIIIRQNRNLETEILPPDPHRPTSDEFKLVGYEYAFSPKMLLLASLGSCTAGVLHTYAKNHSLDLQEVEVHLEYERAASDHGEDGESDNKYHNRIRQQVKLIGELDPDLKNRIFLICRRCSVHSILEHGIEVHSELMPEP